MATKTSSASVTPLYLMTSFGLALVFVSAAVGKLIRLPDFLRVVYALDLLPSQMIPLLAFLLIGLELTIALCLVLTPLRLIGGLLSCTLLVFFIAVVGYALYHGLNVSCGCFVFLRDRSFSVGLLVQNIVLLALSVLLTRALVRHDREADAVA